MVSLHGPMDVGPTLQFTQKLLNSMIGLWKQLKINIDYQPPQKLSFRFVITISLTVNFAIFVICQNLKFMPQKIVK